MMLARLTLVAVCLGIAAAPGRAQSFAEHIRLGDSLHTALRPAEALEHYRAGFFADPESYEAMWKFARSQVDVAKQLLGDDQRGRRDSLYTVARVYAEAAVRANPDDAEGHFQLAQALGRLSRTRGGRERVQFAREIYDAASRAIALDRAHDGAHHVLGAWHAEILRLSGVTRFFARTLLGAGFMSRASWDSATAHLERAVALEPAHIFHRYELAEIYVDTERFADAAEQLRRIEQLPPTSDVMDPFYKEEAAALAARLRGRPS